MAVVDREWSSVRRVALVSVVVALVVACCLGGCVLLFIAPDQMAAFSPANW
ncbi:hypothetical protein ACQP00_40705 [Dactylosporangium sp. CS-047395]|uniref:hypothetical protein n=1 Tax=Dactylosporangium sp. CS-047395 TaxID=3239936 RepID=UPI003D93E144